MTVFKPARMVDELVAACQNSAMEGSVQVGASPNRPNRDAYASRTGEMAGLTSLGLEGTMQYAQRLSIKASFEPHSAIPYGEGCEDWPRELLQQPR